MDPTLLTSPAFWSDPTPAVAGVFPGVLPDDARLAGQVLFETSGSSGKPKWIALSKQALLASAAAVNRHLEVNASSCWGLVLPLHHVGGFGVAARAYQAGCRLEILDGRWDAGAFAAWVADRGVTHTSLVPTQVHDLVAGGHRAPDCITAVVVGGGCLDERTGGAARALGWPVLASYGMTEACSQIATQKLCAVDDSYTSAPLPLLPIWQVRTGDDQRLSLSGPALFSGFIVRNEDDWIFQPRAGEWFESADRVAIGEGGLTPLGRADLLVKVLGELVDPEMIERELMEISGGKLGSGSFAVVAVPDARAEHVLVPVFDASVDAEMISSNLTEYHRRAPGFRRLREAVFLKSLPRSPLGKPRRAEILQKISLTPPPDEDRERMALRRTLLKLTPGPEAFKLGGKSLELISGKDARPMVASCCGGSKPATASSCCGGSVRNRPDFLLWGSTVVFLVGVTIHFLLPAMPVWAHVFGHTCVELLAKSWWGLLFGIIAVAVLGRVPPELVAAVLGRGGSVSGLFRAVAAGVALDLCNHGILMVGMGLYKRGASLGQTLAFLIASPWNSLSLTLILAALIGWKWMLLFIALSAVVALLTGWVADRLVASGKIPANPNTVDLPVGYRIRPALVGVMHSLKPGKSNYARLFHEGVAGSRMVLRWILFGFVLTGLIRAFVPELAFQQYFGPTMVGMLLTLLATTVLEVCSEGSSPIAADLLTRAHAPGNAFVFLMTGAATDYTEILSLRETTRSWKASLALPLISTPQVILIGWWINHFSG